MLKKTLASLVIGLFGMNGFAFNAPYVGAGIGINTNTSNVKVNNATSYAGGSYRGVPFNVLAGYGGVFNENVYIAGELFATLGTASISDENNLRTTYSYGISVLPGFMLNNNTTAYGRLGILQSYFDSDATRTGAQFGLGLQTCVAQNVDLRGEYDFVAYKSINGRFSNGDAWTVGPRSDQVSVSVIYKFD